MCTEPSSWSLPHGALVLPAHGEPWADGPAHQRLPPGQPCSGFLGGLAQARDQTHILWGSRPPPAAAATVDWATLLPEPQSWVLFLFYLFVLCCWKGLKAVGLFVLGFYGVLSKSAPWHPAHCRTRQVSLRPGFGLGSSGRHQWTQNYCLLLLLSQSCLLPSF